MSIAAETYVESIGHPQVKGSVLALLRAIAKAIPDGQTATPAMRLEEFAIVAGYTERTALRCRDVLEALALLKVHDGGRGIKTARYELRQFGDGARPLVAQPLPLIGRSKPPKAKDQRPEPDLFTDVEAERSDPTFQRSDNLSDLCRKVGSDLSKVRQFVRRLAQQVRQFVRPVLPQGVPITVTATTKNVRTEDLVEKLVVDARDPVQVFLAWWTATFPTYNRGAFNSVDRRRDGPRVQTLLASGRPVAHLQAMAIELWTTTTDGRRKSDRWWIAEVVKVRTIAVLRWKATYLDDVVTRRQHAPSTDDVWRRVLTRLETQVSRDAFHTWIRPLEGVHRGDTIQVGGSAVHVAWVQRHHAERVRQAVEAERPGTRVEFVDAAQKYG